ARTTSDARGRFRLEGLGSGHQLVSVRARGFGPEVKQLAPGQRFDVVLVAGGTVYGLVLDPARKPLADAMIRVIRVSDEPEPNRRNQSDRTDATGRYDVGGLEAGTYRVV